MKTKHAVFIAVAFGCLGFAAGEEGLIRIPYRALGDSAVLIGELGQPLGEEVMVRGKLSRKFKKNGDQFVISELNGRKLEHDVSLSIRGVESWPDGTEATIVGSEEGTITYRYRVPSASVNDPPVTPRQIASNYFVPVEVVSSRRLELSNDEAKYGRQSTKSEGTR